MPSNDASDASKDNVRIASDLSKETWEYLELKLWNSFSKKFFVLVGVVVTLLGASRRSPTKNLSIVIQQYRAG